MSNIWLQIALIAALVVVNAFFAMSEIALVSTRQTRFRKGNPKTEKALEALRRLTTDPGRFLATIQIGITLAGFLASASAAVTLARPLAGFIGSLPIPFLQSRAGAASVVIVTLILSYLTLVFGELVPKRMALQYPDRISLRVAQSIEILAYLSSPLVRFLTFSSDVVVKLLGGDTKASRPRVTEEEIKQMIAEQKTLLDAEKSMIHEIFDFGDTVAREVMVPRLDIVALPEYTPVRDAAATFGQTHHSRIPVYNPDLDYVTGIVSVKDVLQALNEDHGGTELSEIKNDVYFVPDSKNVINLLREMQLRQTRMAVVIDEWGGTTGLVTVEMLLEEIVGEIREEHEREEEMITKVNEGEFLVLGGADVDDINETLGLAVPTSEHYETLGGFLLDEFGHIPEVGESIDLIRAQLSVEKMDRNRVGLVRILLRGPRKDAGR